jgi:DNA primase
MAVAGLPHVQGRPLTLVHCPNGVSGSCSYLRHAKAWGPSALRRVKIQEKTKVLEYLVADTIAAVVALAQMGVVAIHTWNSTAEDVRGRTGSCGISIPVPISRGSRSSRLRDRSEMCHASLGRP